MVKASVRRFARTRSSFRSVNATGLDRKPSCEGATRFRRLVFVAALRPPCCDRTFSVSAASAEMMPRAEPIAR
eukprot:scaffold247_cov274-Pinguiococcus_pyrenoidosus.AAC.10